MQFSRFQVLPVSFDFACRVRETQTDEEGNTVRLFRSPAEGEPVRDSLRRSRSGEGIILCAYSPFRKRSPYREVGPIFLLADGSPPAPLAPGEFPPDFTRSDLVLRAYNVGEETVCAELLVAQARPEPVIEKMFENPAVDCIHVRFAAYGCFACRIERPSLLAA